MSSTRPKPHLKRHFSLDTDPVATLFLSFSHQDCHSTASAPEILAAMLSCPKRVPDGIEPSQMSAGYISATFVKIAYIKMKLQSKQCSIL